MGLWGVEWYGGIRRLFWTQENRGSSPNPHPIFKIKIKIFGGTEIFTSVHVETSPKRYIHYMVGVKFEVSISFCC